MQSDALEKRLTISHTHTHSYFLVKYKNITVGEVISEIA